VILGTEEPAEAGAEAIKLAVRVEAIARPTSNAVRLLLCMSAP
jgi:hypothetical protein